MNNVSSPNQNFRNRRNNNYKKNPNGGGGHRQDFRRGPNNNMGGNNHYTNSNSNQARHPELDIVIDAKAAKRASMMRDKYLGLARDAQSGGDRVLGENYLQHADHYNRILTAFNDSRPQHLRQPENNEDGDNDSQTNEVNTPPPAAVTASAPMIAEEENFPSGAVN